jgi:hypothetical protein
MADSFIVLYVNRQIFNNLTTKPRKVIFKRKQIVIRHVSPVWFNTISMTILCRAKTVQTFKIQTN